jgi:uncharacterized membrane protein (UPF0136 family)
MTMTISMAMTFTGITPDSMARTILMAVSVSRAMTTRIPIPMAMTI